MSFLGIGGWLAIDGVIARYFATPLTQENVDKYSMPIGEAKAQQLLGSIADFGSYRFVVSSVAIAKNRAGGQE